MKLLILLLTFIISINCNFKFNCVIEYDFIFCHLPIKNLNNYKNISLYIDDNWLATNCLNCDLTKWRDISACKLNNNMVSFYFDQTTNCDVNVFQRFYKFKIKFSHYSTDYSLEYVFSRAKILKFPDIIFDNTTTTTTSIKFDWFMFPVRTKWKENIVYEFHVFTNNMYEAIETYDTVAKQVDTFTIENLKPGTLYYIEIKFCSKLAMETNKWKIDYIILTTKSLD